MVLVSRLNFQILETLLLKSCLYDLGVADSV